MQHADNNKNPFLYLDTSYANSLKNGLVDNNQSTIQLLDLSLTSKPNIILIIWESCTQKAINNKVNNIYVTPGLNELIKEGIYFSDFYATGDRTDKGIVGILSGYPSQPTNSIIKIPQKSKKLPKLPQIFLEKNYETSFYYGGELEFANMKSYLIDCGFQKFISKNNFNLKDQNSKWGAHDGVVALKLLNDLKECKKPFFTTWLTLSSHEPYETPENTVIKGSDYESLFLNSLNYSDSVIYNFIQNCKEQPFWNNTLIIIVADHGHPLPKKNKRIEDFKIPMLWTGGILSKSGLQIRNTGSQIDIASTLLSQMHINQNSFIWSKNLLSHQAKNWAYFSFNNGFGYVEPNQYYIFDNIGKQVIENNGLLDNFILDKGKSLQQLTFDDYLSK